jgi:hypothetical protein
VRPPLRSFQLVDTISPDDGEQHRPEVTAQLEVALEAAAVGGRPEGAGCE